jgi:hypothetical protein
MRWLETMPSKHKSPWIGKWLRSAFTVVQRKMTAVSVTMMVTKMMMALTRVLCRLTTLSLRTIRPSMALHQPAHHRFHHHATPQLLMLLLLPTMCLILLDLLVLPLGALTLT